ncbi:MAG: PQQ-binding-like beta-propeller repeat protein [Planctomycetota bacterium]
MRTALLASLAVCIGTASLTTAQDARWPGFRGPAGDGQLGELSHPATWSLTGDREANIAWTVDLPGYSWSSPLVVGETAYLVTAVTPDTDRPKPFRGAGGRGRGRPTPEVRFAMLAVDMETGDSRWSTTLAERVPSQPTHPSNTFATETPVTDGERIYAHFGSIGLLVAVDLDGREVWRAPLPAYRQTANFGTASSVVLWEDRVIVHSDNFEESFIVAHDAETGEQIWRAEERPEGSSWASPIIAEADGSAQLIAPGSGHVTAYDPANGSVLWKVTGVPGNFDATPVVAGDRVIFGNSGRQGRGPMIAVELSARGEFAPDPDDERVAWVANSQGFTYSSPVVVDGVVYAARGSFFGAHDAETGERIYRKRLPDQSEVVASLWTDGERIFAMNEVGLTFVVKAGREYELLGTNEIEGDLFSATPSAADGSLLIRGADKLYCIRAEGAG